MKTLKFFQSLAVLVAVSSFSASAQMQYPQRPPMGERPGEMHGERPQRPVRLSPQEKAERRTDEMHKVVNLADKQYKKIYKIYLKEENAKSSAMSMPMGMPPGGMGGFPGGGFPGGGFPGGGFEMGGGFPGGPGAGGPPAGMFPGGFGELPKPTVGGKEIDSDEYIDAREEKFKKILTPEQYSAWRAHKPDPTGFFIK